MIADPPVARPHVLADVATVIAALTDAAEWHEHRASLVCSDCAEHPADLCDEHSAALDAAAAYRALARRLGDEECVSGPYETERDAMRASWWKAETHSPALQISDTNRAQLGDAVAGIEMGTWDWRIIDWLAGYEPSTVTVICGIISRARGLRALRERSRELPERLAEELAWYRRSLAELEEAAGRPLSAILASYRRIGRRYETPDGRP